MVCLERGYTMILNEKLEKESIYTVSYEIGDCLKYVNGIPVFIKYNNFLDILKSNINYFNNSNNKPTQSGSCNFEEIDSISERRRNMEDWVIKHKEDIEKEFDKIITDERLFFFWCYDTLDDMRKEFYDLVDTSKPYIKKVLDKWVIQIA